MRKHIIIWMIIVFMALNVIGNAYAEEITGPVYTVFWIANSKTVYGTTAEVTENRQYMEDLLGLLAMEYVAAGNANIGYIVPLYSAQNDWAALEVGDMSFSENVFKGVERSRELKASVFPTNEKKMASLVDGMQNLLDFIADKESVELVLISNEDIWCRDSKGVANAKVAAALQDVLNAPSVTSVTCYALPQIHNDNPLNEKAPKAGKKSEEEIETETPITYVVGGLEEKKELLYPTKTAEDGSICVLIDNQKQLTLGLKTERRMQELPQVYYYTQEDWDNQNADASVVINEQDNVALVCANGRMCIATIFNPAPGVYRLITKEAAKEYTFANEYYEVGECEISLTEKKETQDGVFWRNESVEIYASWKNENAQVHPDDFLCTATIEGESIEKITLEYDPENNNWRGEFTPEQAAEYTVKVAWTHEKVDWVCQDDTQAVIEVLNSAPVLNEEQNLTYQIMCVGSVEAPLFVQGILLEGMFADAENDALTYHVFVQHPDETTSFVADPSDLESEDELLLESDEQETKEQPAEALEMEGAEEENNEQTDLIHASVEDNELITYSAKKEPYSVWVVAMDEHGAESEPVEVKIECLAMEQIRVQIDGRSEAFFRNQTGWITFSVSAEDVEALQTAGLWEAVSEEIRIELVYQAEDCNYREVLALSAEDSMLFDNIKISSDPEAMNTFTICALYNEEVSNSVCFLDINGQPLEVVDDRSVFHFEAMNSIPVFNGVAQDEFEIKIKEPFKEQEDEETIQIDLTGAFTDDTDPALILQAWVNEGEVQYMYACGEQTFEGVLKDKAQAETADYLVEESALLTMRFCKGGAYQIMLDVKDTAGGALEKPVVIRVRIIDLYERSMILLVAGIGAFVMLLTLAIVVICLSKPKYKHIQLSIAYPAEGEGKTLIILDPLKSKGITLQQLLAWSQYYPDATLARKDLEAVVIKPSRRNTVRVKSLNVGGMGVYRKDEQIFIKQGSRVCVEIYIQNN